MLRGNAIYHRQRLSKLFRKHYAGMLDLRPLVRPLLEAIDRGNQDNLDTDWRGKPLHPLAKRTQRQRAKTRGNRNGPPLSPRGNKSRVSTRLRLTYSYRGDALLISGQWPMSWMKYHIQGGPKIPQRDIAGIRPVTMSNIHNLLSVHFGKALNAVQFK